MNARIVACLLALAAPAAHACSCGNTTPERIFDESTQVFLAEIVAVQDVGANGAGDATTRHEAGRNYGYRATFRLLDSIKGDAAALDALGTGYGGGDCGVDFVAGHRYLVNVRSAGVASSCGIVREVEPTNCAWPALRDALHARAKDGTTPVPVPNRGELLEKGDCRSD